VIGAGMAGILSAIKLHEAGFDDVAVFEKAGSLGGTWRENTYPGLSCDVPSHLYTYSFAPNPEWSHVFSPGAEIRSYLEEVALRYGLDGCITYNAEVTRLELAGRRWRVSLADGRRDEADFVIAATGVLHHPSYPDIEGLSDFKGAAFHSSRWDHRVSIEGARVGIVGTGSTAVQITSCVHDKVGKLHLFQRTPQWVLPVENPPVDEKDKELFRSDPSALLKTRDELYRSFTENFANAVVDAESPQLKMLEEACRANLENNVADPELRERLRPSYRAACKRLIISPNFYQAVTHQNVELVTDRIARVEPAGVRTAGGRLVELDVLVLATGFRVDRFLRPIEVVGSGGVTLSQLWAKRPIAYLSVTMPGFPNLFMPNGPNGPVGNFSLIDVAELQLGYILQLMQHSVSGDGSGNCLPLSPTRAATERLEAERVEAAQRTVWVTGCKSWYLDDRGIPAVWPFSFDRFRDEMAKPRLEDFELTGS
jgi:cation diffusion facilitator CzcD-associated flavoprotein CzcO